MRLEALHPLTREYLKNLCRYSAYDLRSFLLAFRALMIRIVSLPFAVVVNTCTFIFCRVNDSQSWLIEMIGPP